MSTLYERFARSYAIMADVVVVAAILAFFGATALLVRACNGITAASSDDELERAETERDAAV